MPKSKIYAAVQRRSVNFENGELVSRGHVQDTYAGNWLEPAGRRELMAAVSSRGLTYAYFYFKLVVVPGSRCVRMR